MSARRKIRRRSKKTRKQKATPFSIFRKIVAGIIGVTALYGCLIFCMEYNETALANSGMALLILLSATLVLPLVGLVSAYYLWENKSWALVTSIIYFLAQLFHLRVGNAIDIRFNFWFFPSFVDLNSEGLLVAFNPFALVMILLLGGVAYGFWQEAR